MRPDSNQEGARVDRVRAAYPRDLPQLVDFNRALALETEEKELDPELLRAGVRAVFADPGLGEYFVAGHRGRPVGCLMLTREWSDWRNGTFWWIQSVYVRPEDRGHGVFRALYDFVLRRARSDRGVCGLRLYVERGNEPAKGVYRAVGMRPSGYELFEVDFVHGADGEGIVGE